MVIETALSNPHYIGVAHFKLDPAFSGLRTDARFIALMNRFRDGTAVFRIERRTQTLQTGRDGLSDPP